MLDRTEGNRVASVLGAFRTIIFTGCMFCAALALLPVMTLYVCTQCHVMVSDDDDDDDGR